MNTVLLLLGAVGVIGVALTALLMRQLFRPLPAPVDSLGALFHPERPVGTAYRPVNRLLAEEDFSFLQGQAQLRPRLVRRLRQARTVVLRLYLRDMRADFDRIHGVCRALATRSPDPNFAARVLKEVLRFYGQFAVLYASSFLPWYFDARVRGASLVDALGRLQEAGEALLSGWPSQQAVRAATAVHQGQPSAF